MAQLLTAEQLQAGTLTDLTLDENTSLIYQAVLNQTKGLRISVQHANSVLGVFVTWTNPTLSEPPSGELWIVEPFLGRVGRSVQTDGTYQSYDTSGQMVTVGQIDDSLVGVFSPGEEIVLALRPTQPPLDTDPHVLPSPYQDMYYRSDAPAAGNFSRFWDDQHAATWFHEDESSTALWGPIGRLNVYEIQRYEPSTSTGGDEELKVPQSVDQAALKVVGNRSVILFE